MPIPQRDLKIRESTDTYSFGTPLLIRPGLTGSCFSSISYIGRNSSLLSLSSSPGAPHRGIRPLVKRVGRSRVCSGAWRSFRWLNVNASGTGCMQPTQDDNEVNRHPAQHHSCAGVRTATEEERAMSRRSQSSSSVPPESSSSKRTPSQQAKGQRRDGSANPDHSGVPAVPGNGTTRFVILPPVIHMENCPIRDRRGGGDQTTDRPRWRNP